MYGEYTLYTDKALVNDPFPTGDIDKWQMLPCWHATWGTTPKSMTCTPIPFEWTKGGN